MKQLILALILSSCARHQSALKIEGFEAQIKAFEMASEEQGKLTKVGDLIISLTSDSDAGHCSKSDNETPRIDLNENYWKFATDQQKEILLFHELGHCLLNREHDDTLSSNKAPASIMFTNELYLAGTLDEYYRDHRDEYLKELFKN